MSGLATFSLSIFIPALFFINQNPVNDRPALVFNLHIRTLFIDAKQKSGFTFFQEQPSISKCLHCMIAFLFIIYFLVFAEYHHTFPICMIFHFVHLEANPIVFPHHLYFKTFL